MQSVIIALTIIPTIFLVAVFFIWRWQHTADNRRLPLGDDYKLLRSPGEHLMKERSGIEDNLSFAIMVVIFGPTFVVATMVVMNSGAQLNFTMIIATYTLVCLPALYCFWHILSTRRTNRLGLMGERAVGEELNLLMLDGCRVYHDFVKDTGGNIDHIVVARSGVYCVETKCRRKEKGPEGHIVRFDGKRLHSPSGSHNDAVNQTKGHVKELSRWLHSAVGEEVVVKGILTFPGWYVDDTREGEPNKKLELHALNPGQIRGHIGSQKEKILDAKLRKQIAHQLEQRCRNVAW